MRVRRWVVAGLSVLLAAPASGAQKPGEFVGALRFDVSDTTELRLISLDRRLFLRSSGSAR